MIKETTLGAIADFDGKFESFHKLIRVVKFEDIFFSNVTLYPNPVVNNQLYLQLKEPTGIEYSYEIYSYSGQLLVKNIFTVDGESSFFKLEILKGLSLTKGTYCIKLAEETSSEVVLRFIVK